MKKSELKNLIKEEIIKKQIIGEEMSIRSVRDKITKFPIHVGYVYYYNLQNKYWGVSLDTFRAEGAAKEFVQRTEDWYKQAPKMWKVKSAKVITVNIPIK